MAIKLHIQENNLRLKVCEGSALRLKASEGIPIYPENYTGDYEITPTEAEQSLVSHGLMMTDDVTVHAIASDYVGSGITRRGSTDITASGATVSVPSGFYESSASKSVTSGSASTPATSITAEPIINVDASGLISASVSATKDITPTVSPGYVSSGSAGTVSVSGSKTSQLSTQGATTITPSTSEQTAVGAGKYTLGDVKVAAMPTGTKGNQVNTWSWTSTKKVLTVSYPDATAGYYAANTVKSITPIELTRQTETVTPTESTQEVTPTNGTYYLEKVTVNPIPPQYIVPSGTKPITANGTGIDVTIYATVDVAVPSGEPLLQAKTNISPTTSSQTITADNGYDGLSSVQINAMPSGTAGTPTATKGTVSNHSVSVTPSVTNTAGYISGGTKTGTAVSVSASELVSGTLSITSSGTKDVTNYASASVASGGATASATKGAVSNHSISVTPSVTRTAGYITAGTASGTAVTVSASELVSGSETKTANGTYDVTNLAELVVNVSGGGGASNFVTGTFKFSQTSASAQTITLDYSGTGYPIACIIVLDDGVLNDTYTNTVARYSIAQYFMTKTYADRVPTYTSSTTENANYGAVATVYKSSSSTASTLTRTASATVSTYNSSNATGSTTTCVRFKSKTSMSIYAGANSGTSRYGFFNGLTYRYWVIYSA